jgi:hypothetical protein
MPDLTNKVFLSKKYILAHANHISAADKSLVQLLYLSGAFKFISPTDNTVALGKLALAAGTLTLPL